MADEREQLRPVSYPEGTRLVGQNVLQYPVEEIFSVCVHPIHEKRHDRDGEQKTTGENDRESPLAAFGLDRVGRFRGLRSRIRRGLRTQRRDFPGVHPPGKGDGEAERQQRDQQQHIRRHDSRLHQPSRDRGPKGASGGGPDGDERKDPATHSVAVDVGCESPELGHDEHPEHAHPEIEDDPHERQVVEKEPRLKRPEDDDIPHEEDRGAGDEITPRPGFRETSVERNHGDQDQRLEETRIGLDLDLRQTLDVRDGNPSLAKGFHEIVGAQHQEDVREHEKRAGLFAVTNVGEESKERDHATTGSIGR